MKAGHQGPGGFDPSFGEAMDGAEPDADSLQRREDSVRANFWDKFRRVAGMIPFAEDLVAAYYCALDTGTPVRVRAMLLGALAYFILPIDVVPDFIAGFGFTDDAAVLAAAISMVSAHITPAHRAAAAKALLKQPPDGDEAGSA